MRRVVCIKAYLIDICALFYFDLRRYSPRIRFKNEETRIGESIYASRPHFKSNRPIFKDRLHFVKLVSLNNFDQLLVLRYFIFASFTINISIAEPVIKVKPSSIKVRRLTLFDAIKCFCENKNSTLKLKIEGAFPAGHVCNLR